MGDISEMRGLVFVISFLAILVLLIGWTPAPLLDTYGYQRQVTPPTTFESMDVFSFAESENFIMNGTCDGQIGQKRYIFDTVSGFYAIGLDIGNRDFTWYYQINGTATHETKMQLNWFNWIWLNIELLDWYNMNGLNRGEILDSDEMLEDSTLFSSDNDTAKYRVVSPTWNFHYWAIFTYNATKWSGFDGAWDGEELFLFWAVDFDQINTSYNAFQLISMLLFFQLPWMNVFVNALIAIPMWIAIAYLVYILILRAIGAIFGGGGA